MKKFILITLALVISVMAFAQIDITIGTGTSTGRYPFNDFYVYSRSQCIYLESEIGYPGTIHKLRWYRNDTGADPNAIGTTQIWLKTVTNAVFTDANWEDPGTLVYEIANIDLGTGGGWYEVDITDFNYTGGNLLVSVYTQNAPYVAPHAYWRYTATTGFNRCRLGNSDTVNPPTLSLSTSRPNIQINMTTSDPTTEPNPAINPSPANASTNIPINVTLSWSSGGGFPTGYKLSFGTVSPFATVINQLDLGTVTTYDPDLAYSTEYWWKITPYNTYGEALDCPTWTFTTADPPLTGTKTIGSGGNYATFTDAVNALNTQGVGSGGVTFNVSAGSVFEENIPVITATGTASNPIIFQKAGTGDNPVIKPSTATAGIQILGGDYITFDGIDVTRPTGSSTYYGYSIKAASATDGAQYNTIKNCKIILDRTSSSCYGIYQYYNVTPTAAGGTNSNNTYQNIVIENAYRGFHLYQSSSSYLDENNKILNCTIGGTTAGDITGAYGIYTYYQQNLTVSGNTIRNMGYSYSVYGMYIYYGKGTDNVISGNRIYNIAYTGTSSGYYNYGMYVYPTGTSTFKIYNNMIWGQSHGYTTATTSFYLYGIYLSSSSTTTYYVDYNSVKIDGPANLSSACLYFSSAAGTHYVRNNILANVSAGHSTPYHIALYSYSATVIGATGSTSDHNVIYIANSLGGYPVRGSSTNYATLQAWTTASSQDANSRPTDPQFDAANPLNILTTVPTPVEGKALALDYVTTDIYGTVRNATTPDIGAHEGNFMEELLCQTPTAQPTNLVLIPYSTSITGSFAASSPAAEGYLVIGHQSATLTFSPVDGTYYSPAQNLGNNEIVLSFGSSTSFTATGLTPNTQYYCTIFAMNINGVGAPKYNRTNPLTGTQTTLPAAPAAPTAFTATAYSSSQINLSATATADIMVAWSYNSTFGTPLSTGYSVGGSIAGGGTVLYLGPAAGLTSHTGLNDGTTYYYKVWSYITAERTTYYAFSTTGLTANATTPQIPATLPLTENFEVWPNHWTVVNGTQPNQWYVGTAAHYAGNQSAYITNDNGVSNAYNTGSSSLVHLYRDVTFTTGAADFELSFMFNCGGESTYDGLKVYLVDLTTTPVAGTELSSGQIGNTWYNLTTNWTRIAIPISGTLAGTTKRLVISWKNDSSVGTQPPAAIDNLSLEAYLVTKPTNLTATNITETSAVLNWTSSLATFDLEWGALGFALGTGTLLNNISKPYTLNGLTSGTGYTYYVRAKDGGNNSAWAGPYSFYTAFSIPYSTNFDAETNPAAGWWSVINSTSTSASVSVSTTTPHSTPNNIYMYNPSSNPGALVSLVSPVFNTTLSNLYLRFWARGTDARNLYVGVVDGLSSSSTFTQLAAIPLTTTYTVYTVDLSSYSGSGQYISFRLDTSDNVSQYVYIDDVTVATRPYDELAVTALTATPLYKFTESEFTFNITVKNNGTNSSGKNVTVKQGETTIGTIPVGNLNHLSSVNLTYNWTPDTAGTFTFTAELPADNDLTNNTATLANVEIYAAGILAEGFEEIVFPPVRWVAWQGEGQNAWLRTTASNYDGIAATGLVLTSTNTSSYLATPQLIFSPTSSSVTFYARSTVANLQLQAYYGTSIDGTGYTALGTPITLTTTYTQYTVPGTAALNGNYRIAFQGLPNGTSGTIYMDKVIGPTIFIPAEAPGPAALVAPLANAIVNPASLILSWTSPTSGGSAIGYYVRVLCDSLNYLIEDDDEATDNAFWSITEELNFDVYAEGYLLNYNTSYWWQIIPYNDGGRTRLSDCLPRKLTTIKQISAPATLALGNLFAGRTKTGEITVQNVSPTQSLTFSATGEHFTFGGTQPYTIPANSSMQLAYTFSIPEDLGAYSGVITLNQPTPAPGSVLTIQVSGTVIEDPTISTLPFFEGFEVGNTDASSNIKNWTQVTGPQYTSYYWTANSSLTTYNRTPRTGSFNVTLHYSGQAWLFRPIELTAATTYEIELWARQDGNIAANAKMMVSYGDAPSIAGMTNPIIPQTGIINGDYQRLSGTFTPTSTGTYYIGINGWINSTPWYISLDDIKIRVFPTEPEFSIYPSESSVTYPQTVINQTSTKQFTITNTGGGTLTLNSIIVNGNYYSLSQDADDYTLDSYQSTTFKVAYTPTVVTTGSEVHTGTITITYGEPASKNRTERTSYLINLSGTCVDPRIYPPYTQNFDGVTTPNLPLGWTGYVNSTSTSAYVQTSTSYPVSSPNSVYLTNSSDAAADLRLISPQVMIPMNQVRLSFSARGSSAGYVLLVGTSSTADGTGVFTQFASITLTATHT
ncbi:MAG: choice-of-anchor J domain-containing protein, partial [Candidatus Cloacimonas acidaminovorans]|nr:choice-of-anchor J domain-containing protein [Candidatus Cloacimonas acidaminovorans]